MRIDTVELENFRCFEKARFDWHPTFNLIAGKNASGKTAILDALAVAAGSYLLGVEGAGKRHIGKDDVRMVVLDTPNGLDFIPYSPPVGNVEVKASGLVGDRTIEWSRVYQDRGARANNVREIASALASQVTKKDRPTMPLLGLYGTGRLWLEPRHTEKLRSPEKLVAGGKSSPLDAYLQCMDPRISSKRLRDWIARQAWSAFQQGEEQSISFLVRNAIVNCIEGARRLEFNAKRGEIIVEIEGQGKQPFSHLSDGQRNLLALVGDIAQRAVQLNSHLGVQVLNQTPGVVLIDEVELHLHPSWQRSIVPSLKETFPCIQFFCTTHSPQVIGEVSHGEVYLLDGRGSYSHPEASKGLDSNEILDTIQGAESRDPEDLTMEHEFLAALDDFNIVLAASILNQLRESMDSPNAAVSRWETLLGNAKALLEEGAEN
jgi:predicted ATP-binding protein involved in virulence